MNTTYNEFLVQTPQDIWIEKVGYDNINKKMIAKAYTSLYYILEHSKSKPSWTAVVKHMLTMEERDIGSVAIGGYYSTIRTILKDIKVIETKVGVGISKGLNWNRFFGNEDWSWFITNTNSGGCGTIIK